MTIQVLLVLQTFEVFCDTGYGKGASGRDTCSGFTSPIPSNVTVGGWANDADCWTYYYTTKNTAKNYSDKTVYYYIKTEGKSMTLYIYGCGEVGSFGSSMPQWSCANFAEDDTLRVHGVTILRR